MKSNLRIPGPTPLPPAVLKAISKQMINHRGHEYEGMQGRIIEDLKYFFQTKNDIFLFTSSGTGGLEAAIANFFSPGDRLVLFTCGVFGARWGDAARAYGTDVIEIRFPEGCAVDSEKVWETLAKYKGIQGVFVTHNETSVGVLNPVAAIKKIVDAHPSKPLFCVDAVSSLGAVDLPVDSLGIDVVVTASQKAWMAPPGICMVSVSKKAWERHTRARLPRYYFDITRMREYQQKGQTPATPAVGVLFGLDKALEMMKKEGRETIFKRQLELMTYFRKEVRRIGLELFVADECASPTLTSIKVPDGTDGKKWKDVLEEQYGLIVAGGMGELKGKIIRIAHMGYVTKKDLHETIGFLKRSLQ